MVNGPLQTFKTEIDWRQQLKWRNTTPVILNGPDKCCTSAPQSNLNKTKARFILTASLPQRQNAAIFHSAMISDLSHWSARIAGESRILSPAGQRHGFSGKRESKIESYFGVFRSRFFVLIQSEGPISPTWAQFKDVKVSTFPGVKLVKSTEVSGILPLSSTWRLRMTK